MDKLQNVKKEAEEHKYGSFDCLEGEPSCLMASQDSPAIQRPDLNKHTGKQCDYDIEAGAGSSGENPCSRTLTKLVEDSWKHFHEEATSTTPPISDSVICDLCFGQFNDELTLKHHITSVHNIASNIVVLGAVSLKCTKCNFEAVSKEDLHYHALLHDIKKNFTCDLCGSSFYTESSFKIHLKRHALEATDTSIAKGSILTLLNKPYKLCPMCDYKTFYPRHLEIHIKIKHTDDNNCDFKTTQESKLTEYSRIHSGETLLHCDLCDYKCFDKIRLIDHIRSHTCNVCAFKAIQKGGLINHPRTLVKPFHDNNCDFKAEHKGGLISHPRTQTAKKKFHCNHCDFKAAQKGGLINHLRTHTGEKPFHCNLCDFKATQRGGLINHLRTHNGQKPFHCNFCDYKAAQKGVLISHVRTHTGEKPFHCNHCDYKTAYKGVLKNHLSTHTGEKPFHCNLCDYKAAQKGGLVSHLKMHNGEKPFHCNLCDYKAAQKNSLIFHVRTHNVEKPFHCNHCDFKAVLKSGLVTHLRMHTRK